MGKLVTVDFRNDTLFGFERDDGVFVALKPIVTAMGLDWSSQHKRLVRDPVLAEGMVMMTIPSVSGGAQDTVCLRLDLVNGWLFTIDDARIKDESVRQKVLTYKRECYAVLAGHFLGLGKKADADPANPDFIDADLRHEPWTVRMRAVDQYGRWFGARSAQEAMLALGYPMMPATIEELADPAQKDFWRGPGKVIDGQATVGRA